MIDIVLLVLKIAILALLYLFIWQVVRGAVVRRARVRRGARAGRRRCRTAPARWRRTRPRSGTTGARSAPPSAPSPGRSWT